MYACMYIFIYNRKENRLHIVSTITKIESYEDAILKMIMLEFWISKERTYRVEHRNIVERFPEGSQESHNG